MPTRNVLTAADLRALIGRSRVKIYRLAPLVALHPSHLSLILNERRALPSDLALRLLRAIDTEEAAAK